MSVEKINFDKVIKEQIPYTMVYTKVVQKISDPLAGFIWVYLLTLPPNFSINKTQLKNHFRIGDDRLKRILAYLNKSNLIEYVKERDELGRLVSSTINVLCGDKFTYPQDEVSTGVKATRVETHTLGEPAHIKDIYIKNKIKKKKENISCASGEARALNFDQSKKSIRETTPPPLPKSHKTSPPRDQISVNSNINQQLNQNGDYHNNLGYEENTTLKSESYKANHPSKFDQFYKLYPRKKSREAAKKAWLKQGCDKNFDTIIADINSRIQKDEQWKNPQYIPYPATYLNGKRWEDAIEPSCTPTLKAGEGRAHVRVEPQCTVPVYGPGHPAWEANRKWDISKREAARMKLQECRLSVGF